MELKDWIPIIAMAGTAAAFVWQMKATVATMKVLIETIIDKQRQLEIRADAHSDAIHRYETDLAVGREVMNQLAKDMDRIADTVTSQNKVHNQTHAKVMQIFYHLQRVSDHAGHPKMEESTPTT